MEDESTASALIRKLPVFSFFVSFDSARDSSESIFAKTTGLDDRIVSAC